VKKKKNKKSAQNFCGPKPVIFKPTISDTNEVGLTTNLVISFLILGYFNVLIWFENWLSKTLDLKEVLSVHLLQIQNQAVLANELYG
jgi:hypothetical protein